MAPGPMPPEPGDRGGLDGVGFVPFVGPDVHGVPNSGGTALNHEDAWLVQQRQELSELLEGFSARLAAAHRELLEHQHRRLRHLADGGAGRITGESGRSDPPSHLVGSGTIAGSAVAPHHGGYHGGASWLSAAPRTERLEADRVERTPWSIDPCAVQDLDEELEAMELMNSGSQHDIYHGKPRPPPAVFTTHIPPDLHGDSSFATVVPGPDGHMPAALELSLSFGNNDFGHTGRQASSLSGSQSQNSSGMHSIASSTFKASSGLGSRKMMMQELRSMARPGMQAPTHVLYEEDEEEEAESEVGDTEVSPGLHHCRHYIGRVVHHWVFRTVMSIVIFANSVCLGVQMQFILQQVTESPGISPDGGAWVGVERSFVAIFAIEVFLRVLAEGPRFFYGKDRTWNLFDFLLVLQSLLDWVFDSLAVNIGPNLSFFRTLRVLRFARVLRLVRVMKHFQSFRVMVYSIIHSLLSLLWVFLLLLFVIYTFAMFFLFGVADYYTAGSVAAADGPDDLGGLVVLFGSVPRALLTLFLAISGGDWTAMFWALMDMGALYGIAFVLYVFFVVFGVLNIVTSMFVDSAQQVSMKDRDLVVQHEQALERQRFLRIETFFQEADRDGSGLLSWEEFESYLQDPDVKAYFGTLELDVSQARALWVLMDVDETNAISVREFVEGCMRLRGGAKSIDVNMLLYENEKMIVRFADFMKCTEQHFQRIEAALGLKVSLSPDSLRKHGTNSLGGTGRTTPSVPAPAPTPAQGRNLGSVSRHATASPMPPRQEGYSRLDLAVTAILQDKAPVSSRPVSACAAAADEHAAAPAPRR